MRAETVLFAIGEIDDALVQEAGSTGAPERTGGRRWLLRGAAACLCLLLAAGGLYTSLGRRDFLSWAENSTDASMLLSNVSVGGRMAWYSQCSDDERALARYLGEMYAQAGELTWYRPLGLENLKYLIRREADGALTLWEFEGFSVADGETYTYGEVLEIIYGVEGPEDILSLTTYPSKGNNTDFGKEIQRKVGSRTYTDPEEIALFYRIASAVECLGMDSLSIADNTRFTYSFSTREEDKLTSGESTWATRCLSLSLADGTTLDSWIYSALSGSFYEYGGLFTRPLPEAEVYALNDLFGIQ